MSLVRGLKSSGSPKYHADVRACVCMYVHAYIHTHHTHGFTGHWSHRRSQVPSECPCLWPPLFRSSQGSGPLSPRPSACFISIIMVMRSSCRQAGNLATLCVCCLRNKNNVPLQADTKDCSLVCKLRVCQHLVAPGCSHGPLDMRTRKKNRTVRVN